MSSRILAVVTALVLCCASPVLAQSTILPAKSVSSCPACQRRASGVLQGSMAYQSGQPVRNAARAAVKVPAKVAKAAVTVPVRAYQGAAHFFQNRQPVRKVLRACGKVVTGRGPILSRMRGCRGGCCR